LQVSFSGFLALTHIQQTAGRHGGRQAQKPPHTTKTLDCMPEFCKIKAVFLIFMKSPFRKTSLCIGARTTSPERQPPGFEFSEWNTAVEVKK